MLTAKKTMTWLKGAGLLAHGSVASMSRSNYDGDLKYTHVGGAGEGVTVTEETFGKKSFMYFRVATWEKRAKLVSILTAAGASEKDFGFSWYGSEDPSFELRISPIKGWHWWE